MGGRGGEQGVAGLPACARLHAGHDGGVAFAQRRKTSRNAFAEWAGSGNASAERLLAASIDPARRGETLAIADFVRLLQRSGELDREQRAATPEPEQQVAQGEYLAPQSELEQQLAAIWQDVLEVGQVGLNDNFFERGGHSLLVINVMSRIQLELGVKISVHELFQHAQLKQLADHLHAQGSGVSTEKLSFLDSLLDEMEEV